MLNFRLTAVFRKPVLLFTVETARTHTHGCQVEEKVVTHLTDFCIASSVEL